MGGTHVNPFSLLLACSTVRFEMYIDPCDFGYN